MLAWRLRESVSVCSPGGFASFSLLTRIRHEACGRYEAKLHIDHGLRPIKIGTRTGFCASTTPVLVSIFARLMPSVRIVPYITSYRNLSSLAVPDVFPVLRYYHRALPVSHQPP